MSTRRKSSLFHRASVFGSLLVGKKAASEDDGASFAESDEDSEEYREVFINNDSRNAQSKFPANFLKTSHYTLFNFLPLNLFHQFHQISNVYFFLVMVISFVPGVSPITPFSAVIPLVAVLSASAFKDGYEDWKRHRADHNDNSAVVKVLSGDSWKEVPSLEVKVGDILMMERGKGGEACAVKADVVILSSSDDDGVVYIETSQLDGETSVKPRKSRTETQHLKLPSHFSALPTSEEEGMHVAVDKPNSKLYTWQGVLHIGDSKEPLSIKNIIWRGSAMKKTEWATALVIYTGKHTKQGKNLKKTKRKPSFLAKKVNSLVGGIFVFKHSLLFPLCALSTWWRAENKGHWYLSTILTEFSDAENFFLNYMTYFILLSFLIPISLFVTVEMCKVNQIVLMKWDQDMMHWMPSLGWVGCRPKTSDLNEQLAVVKYVFSDKTGTLTENIMRYMSGCVLTDNIWVPHDEVSNPGEIERSGGSSGCASQFVKVLQTGSHADNVNRYLACMAMCHTVVPFHNEETGKANFEGSSPDEVALVTCASANKFLLTKRTSKTMKVMIGTVEHEFEILQELEFTPTRKMMSIILKDANGQIIVFCKGADSSVLNNLHPSCLTDASRDVAQRSVVEYASQQYRTLCLAYREIDEATYQQFTEDYNAVQTVLGKTDEMVDKVCLTIESQLWLIGITGYEDKLQDGVAETIKFLTDAGVIVWMLTGDKLETGIEIGKTCGLADGAEIIPINVTKEDYHESRLVAPLVPDSPEDPSEAAEAAPEVSIVLDSAEDEAERKKRRKEAVCLDRINGAMERAKELQLNKVAGQKSRVTIALDGPTLDIMQGEKEKTLEKQFVLLSLEIHSAICCRLTPAQKGYIVNLFQRESGETALAIGDGANDATMISAAMVGIGIIGLEGSQAELASDYAIPRFRFLKRLLVVHGRYSMYRNSRCVCFSFYKNIVLSLCQVYFAIFSCFSGKTVFDSWLLAIKNTAFSFFPPLLVGSFGKDISEEILMDKVLGPRLYAQMRTGHYFDSFSIGCWFMTALFHGSIIFWTGFPIMLQDDTDVLSGRNGGLKQTGTYLMTMVVFCVLTKAAVHLHQVTSIQAGGLLFSYLFYPAWLWLYSAAYLPDLLGETEFYLMAEPLFSDPKHYLLALLTVFGLVVVVDFTALFLQRKIRPSLRDICADIYDYKDPPWARSLPFFGCFQGKQRTIHPVAGPGAVEEEMHIVQPAANVAEDRKHHNATNGTGGVVLNSPGLQPQMHAPRKTSIDMIKYPVRQFRAPPFPNALTISAVSPYAGPMYPQTTTSLASPRTTSTSGAGCVILDQQGEARDVPIHQGLPLPSSLELSSQSMEFE